MATPIRTTGPVEMLEESVHLLRRAPAATVAVYLVGSVPFLVGFLFFWTEMSSSRNAEANSFAEAFGMALLFVWMNWWKAVFAGRLRRQLEGVEEPRWSWRRAWRILVVQSSAQPLKLVLLPAAAAAILPAALACAFFRNVTALADSEGSRPAEVVGQARRQASLWQAQNWIALAVLVVFSLVVFLNVALTLVLLPQLARILTGYESEFARSGANFALNWTFFAVAAGITWLCVDPFTQAFYVLRCFLGQALGTGEDLKAELRALRRAAALPLLVVAMLGLAAWNCPASGPPDGGAGRISAAALDRSIDQVLAQPAYRWRMPRPASAPHAFASAFVRFTERVVEALRSALRFVGKWVKRFFHWLRDLFGSPTPEDRSGPAPSRLLQVSLWLLAALAAGAGVALVARSRRRRARRAAEPAPAATVDLNDESLVASQLPEETWLALAGEWIAKQDLRMALRALYLGTLAYMGRSGLVTVHACKSNREYETELRRTSRATPQVPPLFRANVGSFERSWYGRHEVSAGDIGQFRANLDRIRLEATAQALGVAAPGEAGGPATAGASGPSTAGASGVTTAGAGGATTTGAGGVATAEASGPTTAGASQ
jgi:hypothetical protein